MNTLVTQSNPRDLAPDRLACAADSDLATVLAAWNSATDRLQQTHETLRREVSRLSDELAEKNRQLARKNRLADLGQMASHVAHEVRNCLVPLTLYLSLLRRRLTDDTDNLQVMDKIEAGFTALEATVNDLLSFTSDRTPSWQQVRVGELVGEIVQSIAPQLMAQGIKPTVDIDSATWISADREMLRRAIMNLVLNAVDVMPQGGELVITGCCTDRNFELEIADSGPGVTDEVKQQLFEPFFTTKSDGTGLGLSIVQRIAESHGGEIDVINCPEGGAAFTIKIPRRNVETKAA